MEPRYKPLGTLKRVHKRDLSDTGKKILVVLSLNESLRQNRGSKSHSIH